MSTLSCVMDHGADALISAPSLCDSKMSSGIFPVHDTPARKPHVDVHTPMASGLSDRHGLEIFIV